MNHPPSRPGFRFKLGPAMVAIGLFAVALMPPAGYARSNSYDLLPVLLFEILLIPLLFKFFYLIVQSSVIREKNVFDDFLNAIIILETFIILLVFLKTLGG